jgi:hypothetical protein
METRKNGELVDSVVKVAIDILKSSKYLSNEEKEALLDLERVQKQKIRVKKINSIFDNT